MKNVKQQSFHRFTLLPLYFFTFLLFHLFTSCTADPSIDRSNVCRFTFTYQDHPTSKIFVAAKSAGYYVFVTTRGDGKKSLRHVYVQSNDGSTDIEDNIIRTDIENSLNYVLGASNDIGLIIGTTNFSGLQAYDRTCPNCDVLRALQWTGDRQHVKCNTCQRVYALETGVVDSGDQGAPLRRYMCVFNGVALNAYN